MKSRLYYEKDQDGERTGKTIAVVKQGDIVGLGISLCHPEHDSFNKKLGRKIALGRANHALKVALGEKPGRNGQKIRPKDYVTPQVPIYMHFDVTNPPSSELLTEAGVPTWLWEGRASRECSTCCKKGECNETIS